jgi:hypothetical protein
MRLKMEEQDLELEESRVTYLSDDWEIFVSPKLLKSLDKAVLNSIGIGVVEY